MRRNHQRALTTWWVLLLVVCASVAAEETAAAGRWLGPDGEPLPFVTEDEVEEFLRKARVVEQKVVTTGVNRPLKLRLERGGVSANAVFRTADIRRRRAVIEGKIYIDFHDSYIYECAAYELSRLLAIDNVPPCVQRTLSRNEGTLQLWVESAMTERDRLEAEIKPPATTSWPRQKQTMRLFDLLIANFDRNQTNMLIDTSWKLWFIDHTRSFRKDPEIEGIQRIVWCDRAVWERLQALDHDLLKRHLKPLLSPLEINALLKRKDLLVGHLERRIAEVGEGAVLFDR